MDDWLKEKLTYRERILYRIAMKNAKDPDLVDNLIFQNLVIMDPERSKREDHESGCGALNTMET